jgi:uncharacterized protein YbjQ (UPF0145 family)
MGTAGDNDGDGPSPTGWNGQGLPPVAASRVHRIAEGGAWTSLLTVPAAVGVHAVGFEPVGEVMGSIVQQLGWAGYGGCGTFGWAGSVASAPRTGAFRPYVDALHRGYDTALSRMTLEAAAIGADGVVGVRLTESHLAGGAREFTALGTAVRGPGPARSRRVFRTTLPGQDVAKLAAAGWLPAEVVYGISVAIRHDDWTTRQQASWGAGNVEVTGYTELLTYTRADARLRLAEHVSRAGADGAIVSSMSVTAGEIEPAENHRDHVAEATVFGTALLRVHTEATALTRSLAILPLRHVTRSAT